MFLHRRDILDVTMKLFVNFFLWQPSVLNRYSDSSVLRYEYLSSFTVLPGNEVKQELKSLVKVTK